MLDNFQVTLLFRAVGQHGVVPVFDVDSKSADVSRNCICFNAKVVVGEKSFLF
jgi:hypothetical protein